jgi:multimeric flavodoxin WrbA
MKAIILDGSRNGDEGLAAARQSLVAELQGLGWQVQTFLLRELEIHHCLGCFGCWVRTPGQCVIDDAAREIARGAIASQMLVYLTPVTFGGYSSELKKAVDRIICLISPFFTFVNGEIHHRKRYERYPRLVGLGLVEDGDEEGGQIFCRLVGRNAINFHSPAHAAAVMRRGQGEAEVRAVVRDLLQKVVPVPERVEGVRR